MRVVVLLDMTYGEVTNTEVIIIDDDNLEVLEKTSDFVDLSDKVMSALERFAEIIEEDLESAIGFMGDGVWSDDDGRSVYFIWADSVEIW